MAEQFNQSPAPTKTEFDSLNEKINTENLTNITSLAALETALESVGASLSNGETKNIFFDNTGSAFGVIAATAYAGYLTRTNPNRYQVTLHRNGVKDIVYGSKTSSGWQWDKFVLNRKSGLYEWSSNPQKSLFETIKDQFNNMLNEYEIPSIKNFVIITNGIKYGVTAYFHSASYAVFVCYSYSGNIRIIQLTGTEWSEKSIII